MSVGSRIVVAQIASVVQAAVVTRSEDDSHMEFNPLYTLAGDEPWSWKI
jgi:hypothetical protein